MNHSLVFRWNIKDLPAQSKKAVWVLNIGNYRPEVAQYTLPLIKAYAKRCGADYFEITERKFSEFPIPYEKFQIWEKGSDYFWNLLIDADVLVGPHAIDVFKKFENAPQTVGCLESFDMTKYFMPNSAIVTLPEAASREGNRIIPGISANFVLTSVFTHNLWFPIPDANMQTIRKNIEIEFMADEYILATNKALFKLDAEYAFNDEEKTAVYHLALTSIPQAKVTVDAETRIKAQLQAWGSDLSTFA